MVNSTKLVIFCSGDCSKAETVDINLPPGLYLVERKLKVLLVTTLVGPNTQLVW